MGRGAGDKTKGAPQSLLAVEGAAVVLAAVHRGRSEGEAGWCIVEARLAELCLLQRRGWQRECFTLPDDTRGLSKISRSELQY